MEVVIRRVTVHLGAGGTFHEEVRSRLGASGKNLHCSYISVYN